MGRVELGGKREEGEGEGRVEGGWGEDGRFIIILCFLNLPLSSRQSPCAKTFGAKNLSLSLHFSQTGAILINW